MSFKNTMLREFEVAFHKNAQPVWFRVMKYLVLAFIIYFLWGTKWIWVVVPGMFGLGLLLHLWYRYKTKGWTQSYRGWKYHASKYGG